MKKLKIVFKKRGKGNIKAQRKRRRNRLKMYPKGIWREAEYELIDGNFSHFAVAFCENYSGYLTIGLMDTHGCERRNCKKLRSLEQVEQKLNTDFP